MFQDLYLLIEEVLWEAKKAPKTTEEPKEEERPWEKYVKDIPSRDEEGTPVKSRHLHAILTHPNSTSEDVHAVLNHLPIKNDDIGTQSVARAAMSHHLSSPETQKKAKSIDSSYIQTPKQNDELSVKQKHENAVKALLKTFSKQDEEEETKLPDDAEVKDDAVDKKAKLRAKAEKEVEDKSERTLTSDEKEKEGHQKRVERLKELISKSKVVKDSSGKVIHVAPSGMSPEQKIAARNPKSPSPEIDPEAQSKESEKRAKEIEDREDFEDVKNTARSSAAADFPKSPKKQAKQRGDFVKSYLKGKSFGEAQKELAGTFSRIAELSKQQQRKDLHTQATAIKNDPNFQESEDVQLRRDVRAAQLEKKAKRASADKERQEAENTEKQKNQQSKEYSANMKRIAGNIEAWKAKK